MTIGERVRQKRLELGMSQEELAFKCGYKSRSSINKIELARDLPLRKVALLAKYLDVSPGYLMGWDKDFSVNELENVVELETTKRKEKFEIIDKLDKLLPEDKEMVINLINSLYEKVREE